LDARLQVDVSPSGRNWIFRSNFPKVTTGNTSQFAFPNPLLGWMQQRAKEEGGGKPFPTAFQLQDISFDNILEVKDIEIEIEWFAANPDKGNLTFWPLVGQFIPPELFNATEREALAHDPAKLWELDQLPSRLATIREWLMDESKPPTVYLWHCEAGCDRTGEFSGAYYMVNSGYNVSGAFARDTVECGRPPNYFSKSAIGWWCETLEAEGKQVGDCLSF
jgi:hypothetical protein